MFFVKFVSLINWDWIRFHDFSLIVTGNVCLFCLELSLLSFILLFLAYFRLPLTDDTAKFEVSVCDDYSGRWAFRWANLPRL